MNKSVLANLLCLTSIMVLNSQSQAIIDGAGTANRIPKFQDSTTLQDSAIYEMGGNVGIGTTNPLRKLHYANGGSVEFVLEDTSRPTNEKFWRVQNYNSKLFFGALNDAFSTDLKVLTLERNGNVGIGTTIPGQMLEIHRGNIILDRVRNSAYSRYIGIGKAVDGSILPSDSGGSQIEFESFADQSNAIHFLTHETYVSHARRMTIDKAGNVGIGTTDPDTWLDGNKGLTIFSSPGKRSILSLVGESGDGENEILGRILFSNPDTTNTLKRMAMIDGVRGANDNSSHLDFSTAESGSISQRMRICSNGSVGIGTVSPSATHKLTVEGNILVRNASGIPVAEMGEGLDFAEGFDVSQDEEVEPGTVLVIDAANPGKLMVSNQAYDSKVAGIAAGAQGLGSGVRLGVGQFDCDVALAGRVYCNVETMKYAIEAGDLLTTSNVAGHAMKAVDENTPRGVILGKAMQSLEKGQKGQILVLVTLQ